ncbi:MAG: ExbD/TolR family protein [Candidatus Eiseniibacteriota bacterium]
MKFSRKRTPTETGIYEPNMTPLIDVSLVLVVILLVATPMAFQSSIAVSRAAESGQKAEPTRTEWVEVTILPGDRVIVNKEEVPRSALGPYLAARIAESATRRVLIRCDDAVPHFEFVGVLDEAKLCGAAGIAVVGGAR